MGSNGKGSAGEERRSELLSSRGRLARAAFEARMAFIGSPATRREGDADAWEAVAAASLGGNRAGRTLQKVFEERPGGGAGGDAGAVRNGFNWLARVLRGANELRGTRRGELAGSGAAWARVEWNGLPFMPWEATGDLETARARARDQCGEEAAFYVTVQQDRTRRRVTPRLVQVAQGEWESVWSYDEESAAAQWHEREAKKDWA